MARSRLCREYLWLSLLCDTLPAFVLVANDLQTIRDEFQL